MKKLSPIMILSLCLLLNFITPFNLNGQDKKVPNMSRDDYIDAFMDDDNYIASLEEWQAMIDQWLDNPICINNEELESLVDYKIISLYQFNKLKEYRLIYGDLLSVYELENVEGWDFQTRRKVIPLVTVTKPETARHFEKFTFRSFRQNIVLKTVFTSEKSKGYHDLTSGKDSLRGRFYTGPPSRIALRYDLEFRKKIAFGLRMEKDPGEPYLVSSGLSSPNIKMPDLLSAYLAFRDLGPVESMIIGNYRVNFGYGINLAGGQTGIKGRSGMSGMAARIRPQTSISENGFFRGAAFHMGNRHISFCAFGSWQKIDGTSMEVDSLNGKPLSFASIGRSGMHRSISELSERKSIVEKIAGGFLVFKNNWMKAGLIAFYNHFNARAVTNSRAYAKFGFSGHENLVYGFSATIWLPKIQFFSEASLSLNKGSAVLTGLQLIPVPGSLLVITCRYFGLSYQNWYGSGFLTSGNNSDETGLQVRFRTEWPHNLLLELTADHSRSKWASYNIMAPSDRTEISISLEKSFFDNDLFLLSFRYLDQDIENQSQSYWICHPTSLSKLKFRLENRLQGSPAVKLKFRIECSLVSKMKPGWLFFHDIEYAPERLKIKSWFRICFFDVKGYDSRIYAYENDVRYDFTSFMHYGKGIRGIIMLSYSPLGMIDIWLRLSTIYYVNKWIGSGWDEIEGNRQNEVEIQVRINVPG